MSKILVRKTADTAHSCGHISSVFLDFLSLSYSFFFFFGFNCMHGYQYIKKHIQSLGLLHPSKMWLGLSPVILIISIIIIHIYNCAPLLECFAILFLKVKCLPLWMYLHLSNNFITLFHESLQRLFPHTDRLHWQKKWRFFVDNLMLGIQLHAHKDSCMHET